MRRQVRHVALGLLVLPGLLVGAAMAAHAQAPIGTEVPYTDADGLTRGTVLIKELGDPFRRDALSLPVRHLAKYKATAA